MTPKNEATLTHITLTGPNAGVVLCGAPKDKDTANFAHVPYSRMGEWLARPEICQDCSDLWLGADDAEENP